MVVVVGTLTGHLKDEQELPVDETEEKCPGMWEQYMQRLGDE